jgi:hypothetical protein
MKPVGRKTVARILPKRGNSASGYLLACCGGWLRPLTAIRTLTIPVTLLVVVVLLLHVTWIDLTYNVQRFSELIP